jgi:hypothetical protein
MLRLRHGHDVGLAQAAVVADIKVPNEQRLAAAAAVGVLIGVLLIEGVGSTKALPAQLVGEPADPPATAAPALTVDPIPPASVVPGSVNRPMPASTAAPISVPTAVPVAPTQTLTPAAPTAITIPLPVVPPVATIPGIGTARPTAPPTAAPTAAPTAPVIVPLPPAISLPPVPPPPLH